MNGRPSAAARAMDAAALALVAAGAALVYHAHRGLESIQRSPLPGVAHQSPNVARWIHYRTISNLGFTAIIAGIVVGIVAWYRSRRELQTSRNLPVPIADVPPDVRPAAPPDVPPG